MTAMRCGTCRHFLADECYRYPPQMVSWSDFSPTPYRPKVEDYTPACGEWKKDDMR